MKWAQKGPKKILYKNSHHEPPNDQEIIEQLQPKTTSTKLLKDIVAIYGINYKEIVLVFDNNPAGIAFTEKAKEELSQTRAILPKRKDGCDNLVSLTKKRYNTVYRHATR